MEAAIEGTSSGSSQDGTDPPTIAVISPQPATVLDDDLAAEDDSDSDDPKAVLRDQTHSEKRKAQNLIFSDW